ncbi:MAG: hypothetical protein NTY98_19750, partial [Verrucomicrobia bacterium]|nr:hypothetical protein [Verrucomicrobiota bacterium]
MKPEQITAWALDEASAEERQQLEAALQENPQDKEKADETKAFCDFLLSELRDDSLALTDKQRERLVAQAAKPQSVEPSARVPTASSAPAQTPASSGKSGKTTRWNIGVIVRLSLAACAVLGGFWTWQAYSSKRSEARAVAAVAEKSGIKVQLAPKPEAKKKAGQVPEARLLAATPVKPVIVAEQPAAKPLSPMPKSAPVAAVSTLAVNKDQRAMSPADVERLKRVQDENAYGLSFAGGLKTPDAVGLVVAGTGMTSQKVEPALAGAALGDANEGVQLAGGDARMPVDTGRLSLNGGTAFTVGRAVSGSTAMGASLTMIPDAKDLLKQTLERHAASLSLKAGDYPPQMLSSTMAPRFMEIGGFIDSISSGTEASQASGAFSEVYGSSFTPSGRVKVFPYASARANANYGVSPYKLGFVCALLPGVQQALDANGWPWMSIAPLELISAADEAGMFSSLAEYQPSVDVGSFKWFPDSGAALVLKTANSSAGSITAQAGASLTMSAFLQQAIWPDFRAGMCI